MNKSLALSATGLLLLVGACSDNSEVNEQVTLDNNDISSELGNEPNEPNEIEDVSNQPEENEVELSFEDPGVPYIPTTMEEVLNFPAGEFEGVDPNESEDFAEVLSTMPELSEEASAEDLETYVTHLATLVAPAYPDPRLLANRWDQLSFLAPNEDGELGPEVAELNVEILLDASGSMRDELEGTDKMTIAKEAIDGFVSELPEEANVALRVYGHIGEDSELSCATIDRVYDLQPYEEGAFTDALGSVEANGWTPLAHAIETTSDDYRQGSEDATNMIVVVSDGMDTCGGDPVAAVEELSELNVTPIISIIGFDVPADEQGQLRDMARAASSSFATADDQSQLIAELDRNLEIAQAWTMFEIESFREIEQARIDQNGDVLQERNEWRGKTQEENGHMFTVIDYLMEEGKIDQAHYSDMRHLVSDRASAAYDIGEEVYGALYDANIENRDRLLEELDELIDQKDNN
ncbi:VWA domain-containing protein [Paenalkalicoccus suaedae]|uniref:VWA domain-containing protein n=1 Tax=Paenalkalicoccus suaedae TaxID=2592382 RepID=A0A859FI30_9BACI|nr:VWA domain-containing protein [Paenalkalicoccus suaedae]QKS72480.1 VWA domain-containing protein [Paenalkalicoccus suaedae]